ncbi:MAG: hypothetical protein OXE17_09755 [Chloroflexi bacterium]|nr:hypothetical protein [Chloroflexota bacterium]
MTRLFPLLTLLFLFLFVFLVGCSTLASGLSGSDCEGCQNVREIQDTYKANPIRAENKYIGERIRIGGVAESIEGSGILSSIDLRNNSEIRMIAWGWATAGRHPDAHRAWEKWVASHDIGDVVEADCVVIGIGTGFGSQGPARVSTEDCVPFGVNLLDQGTDEGGSN